jgi:hypothetical protein
VSLFDALEYAGAPATSSPLDVENLIVDDCGFFSARNVTAPSLGFLALVTDDAPGGPDRHVESASFFPAVGGQRIAEQRLFVVRRNTDAHWTATAGDPFGGLTFSERGAHLGLFEHGGTPTAGVSITVNGNPVPQSTFYFSDASARRSTVDAALVNTASNGAALVVDTDLVTHSGLGGEPPGCRWTETIADAIPGVITVTEYRTQASSGGPCAAP